MKRSSSSCGTLRWLSSSLGRGVVGAVPVAFFWLVEHFETAGNSTGRYHTGFTDLHGNSRATSDVFAAKQYANKAGAEAAARFLGQTMMGHWKAVEHGFHTAPTAQPASPQPLSDDALDLICEKAIFGRVSFQQLARAIEAAHGIGTQGVES